MLDNTILQRHYLKLLTEIDIDNDYINYCTKYSAYCGYPEEELPSISELFKKFKGGISQACFSSMFKLLDNRSTASSSSYIIHLHEGVFHKDEQVTIFIYFLLKDFKRNNNNYCILQRNYIKEWCDDLKDMIEYSTDIYFSRKYNPDSCIVRVDLPNISKTGTAEKLLLSWIRYLYETPYNYCTVDSIRLRRQNLFKNYSLFTLFGLVRASSCRFGIRDNWGIGHSMTNYGSLFPKYFVRKELAIKTELNEICNGFKFGGNGGMKKFAFENYHDAMNGRTFRSTRLPVYKENLKTLESYTRKRVIFEDMNKLKIYVVGGDNYYTRFMSVSRYDITDELENADVVLFTGGEDVTPSLYGKQKHHSTYCNIDRDIYEKSIFDSMKPNQVALGICRGSQFLCAMNGGILVQDCRNHAIGGGSGHKIVEVLSDGTLGKTITATSTHHQMQYPYVLPEDYYTVLYKSKEIRSTIHEGDGIDPEVIMKKGEPEIVYYHVPGKPKCLAVQGHPEMMRDTDEFPTEVTKLLLNIITRGEEMK